MNDMKARAEAAFGVRTRKVTELTFREAFDAMAVGETVRREGWKPSAVGLSIPKRGRFPKPFLQLESRFEAKDGSVEVQRKPWQPYIDDFHTKDWTIV